MQRRLRRGVLLLVDLGLVTVATVLALWLRDNLEFSPERLRALLPYLLLTVGAAALVLQASGVARTIWRFSAMSDYLRILACVVVIVLAAVSLGFLINRLEGVARALPVIQGLLMAFLLVGVRVARRLQLTRRPEPGAAPAMGAQETVLIVGINALTQLYLRSVAELAPERLRIAGIVGESARHRGRLLRQYQILGVPEEIESILKTLEVHGILVNRIVVTTPFTELSTTAREALLEVERKSDIVLELLPERIGLAERQEKPQGASPAPAHEDGEAATFQLSALEEAARNPYLRVKRLLDAATAACCLVLLMPLIVLVALVVVLDVGPPTVFWQQRPGVRGRSFKLYKFRTMRNAHDERGERIPDELRLSAVGRFLRRTRLDELPQLYNILIGEMSFVGPRPLLPADQSPAFAARLLVQPGLTGWAQVKGGREISARDKAALDVWYLRNASFWLDLQILARTIPTLVHGERTEAEAVRRAWDELAQGEVLGPPTGAAGDGKGRRRWQPAA